MTVVMIPGQTTLFLVLVAQETLILGKGTKQVALVAVQVFLSLRVQPPLPTNYKQFKVMLILEGSVGI